MTLNPNELSAVIAEIEPAIRGGWIQKIHQPSPCTILLDIRSPGKTHRLLLSCRPGKARLHFVSQPVNNPQTPPPFCQYLRAHFQGARVEALTQIDQDRIVRLDLTTIEGPRTVMAELTGRKANLLVLDADGEILKEMERVKARDGRLYELPHANNSVKPTLKPSRFDGTGPSAFPLSSAIEALYQEQEATEAADAVRETRARQLKKTIQKRQRRVDAWRSDLAKAEQYRHYDRYGELLKTTLGLVKKGQQSVTVVDYFDESLPQVTIPLDPTKSAQGNLDDYFRKFRKHEAAQRELVPRIMEAEKELSEARRELRAITEGTWQPPIDASPPTLRLRGGRLQPQSREPKERHGPFRRFTSTDGLPIYVGRNAHENDELTFGLAKSDDLWLHAHGTPGSHVVVRMEKGKDPPPETLKDAATLALLYSDLKKSGKGDVIYTRRKWVKKAKGQAPGAVTVTQEKSIYLTLDRRRLDELKARQPS